MLKGKLSVGRSLSKVLVYLEGQPKGIDILAIYFSIVPLTTQPIIVPLLFLFLMVDD
jgi:hypothetical protein